MINKNQFNTDWINQVSKTNQNADKILVEKVIRALLLLEGLVKSEISFVFKGGTSLMLHFNSSKRLSIDIDIIIAHEIENLENILETVAKEQGFTQIKLQARKVHSGIQKAHYKFFYTPVYKTFKEEEYVLLDILFEEIAYSKVISIPIISSFAPAEGESVSVKVPCLEDLLGDKLTAFAPHTTGIPYYKGEDSMSMEIIKQLYDVGNLFDVSKDIEIVKTTFNRFTQRELSYRNVSNQTPQDVLEDIFQTSLCIASRGVLGRGDFKELESGIKRIKGFIFSETYHIEKVIISASKAAYLSELIGTNASVLERFEKPLQVKDWLIIHPDYNTLNKLRKSNSEAFFYWYKAIELRIAKQSQEE